MGTAYRIPVAVPVVLSPNFLSGSAGAAGGFRAAPAAAAADGAPRLRGDVPVGLCPHAGPALSAGHCGMQTWQKGVLSRPAWLSAARASASGL
jgi:hypothetical protein